MNKTYLFLTCIILLLGVPTSFSESINDPAAVTKLKESPQGGDTLVSTEAPGKEVSLSHVFPFSDPRIAADQGRLESFINEAITTELSKSENVTAAAAKYPHDSPVLLTIENKFAYHLFIDDFGLSLYTLTYNLVLSSCGVTAQGLQVLHIESRKGDIFSLQAVPSRKYKLIVERLIKESSTFTKSKQEQEIPLFITVHPVLTFLPAAVIEDKLENLRVDFPNSNVRYCKECKNILPFDEYAYLSWLTISNTDQTEDNSFFKVKDQLIINVGIDAKTIFASYPLDIVSQNHEDDKVVLHEFCLNKERHVDAFVQNVYYQRGLEKFTNDLLFYTVREVADKHDSLSSSEVEVKFPCYPSYYTEKVDTFTIVGTGNLKQCRDAVKSFIQKNYIRSESNQNFDLPSYDMPWPLEGLKPAETLADSKIYVESENLETLLKVNVASEKFRTVQLKDLNKKIEEYCKDFLGEEVESLVESKNKKEHLNSCLHLVYIQALFKRMGIDDDREIRLKIRNKLAESWIKGLTLKNIEQFHSLEKEWFYLAQDRALESYLVTIKEAQESDQVKAMNITFILVSVLAVTFWIGFIVRFRSQETAAEPQNPQNAKFK